MRRMRAAGALVALLLAGCSTATVETPVALDPAAIPSGPIEATGEEAAGPVVELGAGQIREIGRGWRYSVYPTADGWCTQLESAGTTSAGCGPVPTTSEEEPLAGVGRTELPDGGAFAIQGVASEEVATVWVVLDAGVRIPAALMSLEPAGLPGQAFLAIIPADRGVTHLQAVALNGEVLDTMEMSAP